jgi:drug/metabolite transporter (DMT)-like permease
MLVVVTFLWGLSFPLMKTWTNASQDTSCPGGDEVCILTIISLRMAAALLLLAVLRPQLFLAPTWREHAVGLCLGLANFLGFGLQAWGLASVTPALSAFFTSLASVWVPLLAFVFFRLPVGLPTFLGLLVAVAGAAVLAGINAATEWNLGKGEQLSLLASLIFAGMIVLLDRLGRTVRPGHMTVAFLGATGLPALLLAASWTGANGNTGRWLTWTWSMLGTPAMLLTVALMTIFCTVLAFHWFTTYQPRVSANRAALIYLLEPVFASMLSVLWGYDQVTRNLVIGGGLILAGNVLVELPIWFRSGIRQERHGP